MDWDKLVESKIRAAQEEGKFDNLRGRGQPLKLDEDPFEDPAWEMANDLLQQGGFLPDWLELGQTLQAQLEQARAALRRSRRWHSEALAALGERKDLAAQQQRNHLAAEWDRAQTQFRTSFARLNQEILTYNLKVPLDRFQRRRLDVEQELERLLAG
jgi:DnaJ family protein C protein 28